MHQLSQKRRGPDFRLVVGIILLALMLRLFFVAQVLRENTAAGIVGFNWDSHEYVHLAHNLATGGQYVLDADPPPPPVVPDGIDPDPFARHVSHQVSHHYGLLRTPGYPAFLAFFEKLRMPTAGVLLAQAILGSLVPLGVLLLGFALWKNQAAAAVAAIISAVSSAGIGLCGIFLVDVLLGVCVIAGFGLLYLGITRNRTLFYAPSGLAFAAGLLIKPSLLYWPLALGPIALLLAKGLEARIAWRKLALTILLPLLAAGAWSLRNWRVEGGFTFCSVDAQNLRHFMAPLVEETARAGHAPAADALWDNHYAARHRDWDDMASGRLSAVQIAQRQRAECMAVLKSHPLITMASLLRNAFDCSFSGWAYTRLQTPAFSAVEQIVRASDRYLFFFAIFPCWLLMLLAVIEPLFGSDGLRSPENRRRFFLNAALLATFGYFFLVAGTSFSTGFRILYPAEFAMLLLGTSGVLAAVRLVLPQPQTGEQLATEPA